MTEPALPVLQGTILTLSCTGGYTNLGGDTATCLVNGQVVPNNQPPLCKGGSTLFLYQSPNFGIRYRYHYFT